MDKLTVAETASIMDLDPQFLRIALQQGRFPFGVPVKRKGWRYYINKKRLYAYLEAEDLVQYTQKTG